MPPFLLSTRNLDNFILSRLPRYPPCDACEKLKDGLTALSYLDTAQEAEEAEDVEEVREILGCPGVRALLQVIALNAIVGTGPSLIGVNCNVRLTTWWQRRCTERTRCE